MIPPSFGANSRLLPTRRRVLAALLAATALPSWARAQTANPDAVIIGAGAAGLAAAHALAAAGLSFVVVAPSQRLAAKLKGSDSCAPAPRAHATLSVPPISSMAWAMAESGAERIRDFSSEVPSRGGAWAMP